MDILDIGHIKEDGLGVLCRHYYGPYRSSYEKWDPCPLGLPEVWTAALWVDSGSAPVTGRRALHRPPQPTGWIAAKPGEPSGNHSKRALPNLTSKLIEVLVMCAYIYTYIYIYMYTYTCIHIYIYTYTCICTRICIHVRIRICIHTCI